MFIGSFAHCSNASLLSCWEFLRNYLLEQPQCPKHC
uniref:Uncharacterized protein n=1 Tax=Rhizophora mucronata TaxID=61149 RepID=A0A2P2PFD7_RHIMU